MPVVFSPPRDGIHLTEPLAVAGNMRVGGVNTSAADGDGGDEGRPSDAAATAADQSSEVVLCGEGDDGNEEDS